MERYTPEFKTRVVLEALASSETDTSIAQAYGIHPVTLSRWKTQLVHNAPSLFRGDEELAQERQLREDLTDRVRDLERELEVLKALVERCVDIDTKMDAVLSHRDELGLNRACELIGLPKSTYYYRLDQG